MNDPKRDRKVCTPLSRRLKIYHRHFSLKFFHRPKLAQKKVVFHAQYDRTTGVPDNGNEWRKFRAVPHLYPLRSLVLYFCLIRVETETLLDYHCDPDGLLENRFWAFGPK